MLEAVPLRRPTKGGQINMSKSLTEILDGCAFVGLAVSFVHTGFTASVELDDGQWSPNEFGTTASKAIAKCLAMHAPPAAAPLPPCPIPAPPCPILPPL